MFFRKLQSLNKSKLTLNQDFIKIPSLNAALSLFYLCERQATMNSPRRLQEVLSVACFIRVDSKTTSRFGFCHNQNAQTPVFTSNSCNHFQIPFPVFFLCTVRHITAGWNERMSVCQHSQISKAAFCLHQRSQWSPIRGGIMFIV